MDDDNMLDAWAASLWPQFVGDIPINPITIGSQVNPAIAGLVGGGYVIAWVNNSLPDNGIYVSQYSASGVLVGQPTRVSVASAHGSGLPDVAATPDGGFIVSWQARPIQNQSFPQDIFARRFDSTGAPLGPEYVVYAGGDSQSAPAIANLLDGSSIVTFLSGPSGSGTVLAQRLDAAGNPTGAQFAVHPGVSNSHLGSDVVALSDGGYFVTWASRHSEFGVYWNVFGRRYDAANNPVGDAFQLNSTTSFDQRSSSVTLLSDGSFVVAWQDSTNDANGWGIFARRFDSAGVAVGSDYRVNSQTYGYQLEPAIAALDGGGYVIVWHGSNQDGSGYGIFGQRFGQAGQPAGSEFQINSYVTGDQTHPAIAGTEDGGFVVTWSSFGQDGSDWGVFAQRFDAYGHPLGEPAPQSFALDVEIGGTLPLFNDDDLLFDDAPDPAVEAVAAATQTPGDQAQIDDGQFSAFAAGMLVDDLLGSVPAAGQSVT